MTDTNILGNLIRRYREAAGLSQEQLGQRAQMKTEYVGRLERGGIKHPKLMTLLRLAAGLGFELHDDQTKTLLQAAGLTFKSGMIFNALRTQDTPLEEAFAAQASWARMLIQLALADLAEPSNRFSSQLGKEHRDSLIEVINRLNRLKISLSKLT